MKNVKKLLFALSVVFLLQASIIVNAEVQNPANLFADMENLSVIENGDALYLIYCCNPNDTADDYNDFYAKIIDRLNKFISLSSFEYKYVMIDFWREDVGRIGSWTHDVGNVELIQELYWEGNEIEPINEIQKDEAEMFSYNNLDVKYLKHEITFDEYYNKALVVYYEFTNNSNENQTFYYSFSGKCFQNGVEMEETWMFDNQETDNARKEIRPGTTVTVATAFEIGTDTDGIVLEITPWFGSEILLEKQLNLKIE